MTVDATHKTDGWLTAVLRPAGSLDTSRVARLVQALTALAASSDMLIVDLTATTVRAWRRADQGMRQWLESG